MVCMMAAMMASKRPAHQWPPALQAMNGSAGAPGPWLRKSWVVTEPIRRIAEKVKELQVEARIIKLRAPGIAEFLDAVWAVLDTGIDPDGEQWELVQAMTLAKDQRWEEVLRRLEASGARIYRTDRDGQVTIQTDGSRVNVQTYTENHP